MRPLQVIPGTTSGRNLAQWVAERPQPYCAAELASVASRQSLRSAVAAGTVVRLLPDWYVSHLYAESFHSRAAAALAWAGERAMVGGPAALFLYDALLDEPAQIDLVVPTAFKRTTPSWIRLYRTDVVIPPARLRTWSVVPAAVAVAHGYGRLDRDQRTAMLYRSFGLGLVNVATMDEACRYLPRVARRRELMRRVGAIARGAESPLEEWAHTDVFNTEEFAGLIPQFSLRVHGRNYRADFYDPETRTVVEVDGAAFHSDAAARSRDVRRDTDLASVGILTVRLTYADLTRRPQWCRQRVRSVLSGRKPTGG